MHKKSIAIFFTVLFMALLVAPTVIISIDDTIDTSIFYSFAEEEESSKAKDLLSPYSLISSDYETQFNLKRTQFFGYKFKNYPKPHLNLISPPPDYNIL